MPLEAGFRLGPYQIQSALGAGGMGEVYKAVDTRLDRTVAIKVLHDALPGLRERFEREARLVAALQHPHICTLLDIGNQDGTEFLVMEFLEGETLKCPQPLPKVLEYGMQIASALEAAHRKGVTHRDLKPANIMITRSGVKLLDFGIAKWNQKATPGPDDATLTRALTAAGTLIGTLPYMAPEQLEGKEPDARTDIWSFGALLYEMVTGKRAFDGKTQVSLIAAIVEHEPPTMAASQPITPPLLERAVKRCLAKDPDRRWQSALDIKLELESIRDAPPAERSAFIQRRPWAWIAVSVVLLAIAIVWAGLLRGVAPEPAIVRFIVSPLEKTVIDGGIAVSPDGKHLAFTAVRADGQISLWVRTLDSVKPRELSGTEDASQPFWSPDSGSIGFFAGGKLKTISRSGGSPQSLCDISEARGGAWNRDGVILVAPSASEGLHRVNAAGGGNRELVTVLDPGRGEATHRWPQFLPDQRNFLFFVFSGKPAIRGVYTGSLDSKQTKLLLNTDRMAAYTDADGRGAGRLLFLREGTLMSQPFDPRAMQLAGEASPVVEPVWRHGSLWGLAAFSTSQTGILAYRAGGVQEFQLEWFDRSGKSLGAIGPPGNYDEPWLSPDEKRVALTRDPASTSAIWILDAVRGTLSRLTFDSSPHFSPVWSPDGRRIVLTANHEGSFDIHVKNADGSGREELIFRSKEANIPDDWSLDGRFLLFETITPRDVWALPLTGDRKPIPVARSEFDEAQARFSPDGKWVAFSSNESGRFEIYAQPFPPTGAKWQVSTGGGAQPQWRKDGKELYFLGLDRRLTAVEIRNKEVLEMDAPRPLFQTQVAALAGGRNVYAASADGQRFLLVKPLADATPITVVLNWASRPRP
jgi:serine/threonine protein kinase